MTVISKKILNQVGGTYGVKMMKGYLESQGIIASKERISSSLKFVDPESHYHRQKGTQNQLNPRPYYAPYFGYNLHLDQNEKVNI